jgi:hypothetical protein
MLPSSWPFAGSISIIHTALRGTPMRLSAPLLTLLCAAGLQAATVEVRVTSGDLITGEVVGETATTLELKRLVVVRHKPVATTVSLPKTSITSRKEVPALVEQYEARRAATPDSLLTRCALARWCLDRALVEQALIHTREAEVHDRFSPIIAKLYRDLGYLQVDNQWVSEEDHLAATGKVRVGDRVLTPEEAAAAREAQLKAGATARLEQQIRDAEWALKSGEKRLGEATEKRDQAKSEMAKAETEAKGAANRKEQIQKRIEARSGKTQNNRTQDQQREDQAALQEATTQASKAGAAQKKWERELKEAEEELAKVKASIEKAKATLPELQKQLAAAGGQATGKPETKPTDKAAGEKPADKTAGEKPADDKPKNRFGGG